MSPRHLNISKVAVLVCTRKASSFQPVRLAYASYESTGGPIEEEQDPSPLIINHGLFGSKSNWNSLSKAYLKKTGRKVVAVDARNHGDSPHSEHHTYEHLTLDLKELLTQLKLGKVTLLGHSMGGRTAMHFALKYPSFVEKLIVADISPVTTSPNLKKMPGLFDVLQSVDLPKNTSMSEARSRIDGQLAKFIADRGLRNFLLTNLVQKSDGSCVWRINISALKSNFDEIARFPLIGSSSYEGPALFIGGGNSDYLQKSDHSQILKLFFRAEFKYIAGAGHWLHSEKPTEFLEHTVEFLNKHS